MFQFSIGDALDPPADRKDADILKFQFSIGDAAVWRGAASMCVSAWVSILYWRCAQRHWRPETEHDLQVSILYWRCIYHKQLAVAEYRGDVSILYWRCTINWDIVDKVYGCAVLVSILYWRCRRGVGGGDVCKARRVSILYWRCKVKVMRDGAVSIKGFQFSIGDAVVHLVAVERRNAVDSFNSLLEMHMSRRCD